MSKAVGRVVAYHRRPLAALREPTLKLNNELENLPALDFKPNAQGIVIIQIAVKLDKSHMSILPGLEQISQLVAGATQYEGANTWKRRPNVAHQLQASRAAAKPVDCMRGLGALVILTLCHGEAYASTTRSGDISERANGHGFHNVGTPF
jgi:hypothetical protein